MTAPRPIRIVYVHPTSVLYGAGCSLLVTLQQLDRAACEPQLILLSDGPLAAQARAAGVRVTFMPWLERLTWKRPEAWIAATLRLACWLRRQRVAIVELSLWLPSIDGGLLRVAAWMAGARCVLRNRCQVGSWLRLYDKWWMSRMDRIISVSLAAIRPAFRARRADRWSKISPSRVVVIPSGRHLSLLRRAAARLTSLESWGIPPQAPVVCTIGAISRAKRPEMFLRAAAQVIRRVPDAWFLVVGAPYRQTPEDLEYLNEIQQLTKHLGLQDRVVFTGFRDDAVAIMRQCDVFVLTSRTDAGPGVLIEALALGIPVVASSAGGIPEFIDHERTGLLIDTAEPSDYARAIVRLLQDSAEAARMGQEAQRSAQRFDSATITAQLERCYAQVVQAGWVQ